MLSLFSAIPSENQCYIANPDLWEVFHNVYKSKFGIRPKGFWSEAEVVQFLDLEEDKYSSESVYLNETASESEYYAQFG